MSKIKNILIFAAVAIILVLIYIFFIKPSGEEESLVSTSGSGVVASTGLPNTDSAVTQEFLGILLNIKNIKLDDGIFSDPAFITLHDSSIVLVPDGTEGRPNPFAPIGSDAVAAPANSTPSNTPSNPPPSIQTTPTSQTQ